MTEIVVHRVKQRYIWPAVSPNSSLDLRKNSADLTTGPTEFLALDHAGGQLHDFRRIQQFHHSTTAAPSRNSMVRLFHIRQSA